MSLQLQNICQPLLKEVIIDDIACIRSYVMIFAVVVFVVIFSIYCTGVGLGRGSFVGVAT